MFAIKYFIALGAAILLAACGAVVQPNTTQSDNLLAENIVLTSVGPIFSMTEALLEGTDIEVINLPERARSLSAQPTWFSNQSESFFPTFAQATAVISMGNIWQQDPLFLAVREHNIRVVNIDATLPYSSELTGVSVLNRPSTDSVSPHFWLSPANVIRSAKNISSDLARLFPESAERIESNEQQLSAEIVRIKAEFETKLVNSDAYIYALADEFSYLNNEFGIFVEEYFIKQDINWTNEDLSDLTTKLRANNIPVVIHKWEPSEAIQSAISDAGSTLVVLNTFETETPSITDLVTSNLNALADALPQT